MRRARWWANLLLAGFSAYVLLHSTGTISGAGTGVRVTYLRANGIVDYDKACEVNSEWHDPEKLGRFIASRHIGAQVLLALVGLVVAILNLAGSSGLAAPRLE